MGDRPQTTLAKTGGIVSETRLPLSVWVLFAFTASVHVAGGQEKAGGKTVDEKAIEAVLAAYEAAWNQHDMKAWARLFTADVDYVNRAGGLWQRYAQLVAYSNSRWPTGFVEASVRADCVNGTESSPVAFLEGLYVVSEARRMGIATALVAAVCRWAQSVGCRELASDALLENQVSHTVHQALGFEETERVVFFRKALP